MESVKRYGSITGLFAATPEILKLFPGLTVYVNAADFDRVSAENLALQQRLTVQGQRVDDLTKDFTALRDVARECERLASSYSPCLDSVDENGGDDHEDPTCAIFHRLYYAIFDADRALKPTAEAVSHDQ
jgi:hypothetical protein